MKHATTCKFCHMPITVEINDSYDPELDPRNLLPLAACNWCADVRVSRRGIEAALSRVCRNFQMLGSTPTSEQRTKAADTLTNLTQAYARMIARWHHHEGCAWDQECVNLLMDRPDKWTEIISVLWSMYRDWAKEHHHLPGRSAGLPVVVKLYASPH